MFSLPISRRLRLETDFSNIIQRVFSRGHLRRHWLIRFVAVTAIVPWPPRGVGLSVAARAQRTHWLTDGRTARPSVVAAIECQSVYYQIRAESEVNAGLFCFHAHICTYSPIHQRTPVSLSVGVADRGPEWTVFVHTEQLSLSGWSVKCSHFAIRFARHFAASSSASGWSWSWNQRSSGTNLKSNWPSSVLIKRSEIRN